MSDCLQNFLALCASNYYNGCMFHRNIKGFIVQTGDPTGNSVNQCLLKTKIKIVTNNHKLNENQIKYIKISHGGIFLHYFVIAQI